MYIKENRQYQGETGSKGSRLVCSFGRRWPVKVRYLGFTGRDPVSVGRDQ